MNASKKIHGTVQADYSGRLLSGCVVTASNDAGDLETVVTDRAGCFSFSFEPPALGHVETYPEWKARRASYRYSLRFELEGFHPATVDGVQPGEHQMFTLCPVRG